MPLGTWSHDEIADAIRGFLGSILRRPDLEVNPGDRLVADLHLDGDDLSFDLTHMIERTFNVKVRQENVAEVWTVGDLVEMVEHLLAERGDHAR